MSYRITRYHTLVYLDIPINQPVIFDVLHHLKSDDRPVETLNCFVSKSHGVTSPTAEVQSMTTHDHISGRFQKRHRLNHGLGNMLSTPNIHLFPCASDMGSL